VPNRRRVEMKTPRERQIEKKIIEAVKSFWSSRPEGTRAGRSVLAPEDFATEWAAVFPPDVVDDLVIKLIPLARDLAEEEKKPRRPALWELGRLRREEQKARQN
jgi:hypothetical protein